MVNVQVVTLVFIYQLGHVKLAQVQCPDARHVHLHHTVSHVLLDISKHHNRHVHRVHRKQIVQHAVKHQMYAVYVTISIIQMEQVVHCVQIRDVQHARHQREDVQPVVQDTIYQEVHV